VTRHSMGGGYDNMYTQAWGQYGHGHRGINCMGIWAYGVTQNIRSYAQVQRGRMDIELPRYSSNDWVQWARSKLH